MSPEEQEADAAYAGAEASQEEVELTEAANSDSGPAEASESELAAEYEHPF